VKGALSGFSAWLLQRASAVFMLLFIVLMPLYIWQYGIRDYSGWRLLLSRVKVMSRLKLNIKSTPQDGSFVLRLDSAVYDVRVSTLPGREGENIVMRLLNRSARARTIAELGLKKRDEEVVRIANQRLDHRTGPDLRQEVVDQKRLQGRSDFRVAHDRVDDLFFRIAQV